LEYITPEEMRRLEEEASGYGLGVKGLMENAGKGVADFVAAKFPRARRVCVVCGGGNNGGDGFVAARRLAGRYKVDVVLLTDPGGIRTQEARENWDSLAGTGATRTVAADRPTLLAVKCIGAADVLVVAIFGTGVKGGRVREPYASAIRMVNGAKGKKVAVDLPSGIDPSTGAASDPSVRADYTVALHLPKVGIRGRQEYTGEVVVVPIGIRRKA